MQNVRKKLTIQEIYSKGPSILNFESTMLESTSKWKVKCEGFSDKYPCTKKIKRENFRRCVSGSINFYTLINIFFFENIRNLFFQFVFCLSERRRVQVSTISLLFLCCKERFNIRKKVFQIEVSSRVCI